MGLELPGCPEDQQAGLSTGVPAADDRGKGLKGPAVQTAI